MGQQQLLLLVLSIVIVGTAIVVGINAYSENSVRTNWDSMLQEGMRIAGDGQAWLQKPEMFGGSPDDNKVASTPAEQWDGIDFLKMGYNNSTGSDNSCYNSLNGQYKVTVTDSLQIEGVNLQNGNKVVIKVGGVSGDAVQLKQSLSIRGDKNLTSGADESVAALSCN